MFTPAQFLGLAFISLVSMKEHPRNEKGADIDACLDLALLMTDKYLNVLRQLAGRDLTKELQ